MSRPVAVLIFSITTVAVGSLGFGWQAQRQESSAFSKEAQLGRPAPDWNNESWLNTKGPLRLHDLKGRAVLLNFWVYTCYNCTNTVPSLVDFDRKYRNQGLTIIGIHTPEFPPYSGEHDRGNVARALEQYGIEYPNAQDNDSKTWNLYGIRYWPSFVLIDKRGIIRYEGAGEFHLHDATYAAWDQRIRELLAE